MIPGILLLNIVAFSHAWKFTHFGPSDGERTAKPEELTLGEKASTLLMGVSLPKPVNPAIPSRPYQTIQLSGILENNLETWLIAPDSAKGTVLLFHGYGGKKADVLGVAEAFYQQGFRTFLVDFTGHGGSEGNTTTLGHGEAAEVMHCTHYIQRKFPDEPTLLYGFSMGSVAVLKALSEKNVQVDGAIIGAPFGTMLQAVKNRFHAIGVPSFPFAELLVFWGGVQHGYWAMGHSPIEYAKGIDTPILLMYGGKDTRATPSEVKEIYAELKGEKYLHEFPELGHQSFYASDSVSWEKAVGGFIESIGL